MMELKRFRALGENRLDIFDVGLGMMEEREEGRGARQHLALVRTQLSGKSLQNEKGAD